MGNGSLYRPQIICTEIRQTVILYASSELIVRKAVEVIACDPVPGSLRLLQDQGVAHIINKVASSREQPAKA